MRVFLSRALIVVLVAAAVTLAIGAGDATQDERARLLRLPPARRSELVEALRQFDLQLTAQEQSSLRELDRRIGLLSAEDKLRYLAAMRRFHNWLETLPELDRNNLLARPPGERMAQIKALLSRYPVPRETTPPWMQFGDVAGTGPFEVAAWFKIWQELTPQQKREVESLPATAQRRAKLLELGPSLKTMREIRPADFRLEDWTPKVQEKISELEAADPEFRTTVGKAVQAALKRRGETKEQTPRAPQVLRRLAINLYFLEHPPRPVDTERLAQFAAAMPPWIRASFDSLAPDEARRRLAIIYRLLYPKGEFGPDRTGTPAAPGARKDTPNRAGNALRPPPTSTNRPAPAPKTAPPAGPSVY